ncbi:EAL domain-containing protein [Marinobacter sp. SS13-12]|uniref:sensor domain-containing phosphodiesterase n=1 Tax=Marinobacter sp. SS13-12 TaxID=3050451 RepID=UPI0025573574|nr:EAL domain-containing protein [Marinobacter sp. SS13-12]MDK8463040.1 EAL domain-containing protein [Marinobacter sp. SS13-12]
MSVKSEDPKSAKDSGLGSIGRIIHSAANLEASAAQQLVPRILEAVRINLGMEVGFVSRFSRGRREFLHVSSDGLTGAPSPGSSDLLEDSACIRVARNHAPNLVLDAQTHPSLKDLAAVRALQVRTHASVPIPSGKGYAFGTLCCYSCGQKDELDERDIGFMSAMADLIGTVLEEEQHLLDDFCRRREYIRGVVKSEGLQMVWQPIVDSMTGRLVGMESLARFQTDPYRPPNQWFDEAVALGIGTELEKNAFAKGFAIREYLPKDVYVSCNLSGATFLEPEFQEFLKQQELDQIVLEITEHDAIADYKELVSSLSEFRNQGMKLAIDDFGAGYAGFRHILELNPDIIKLDMSLIRNIDRNPMMQSVVKALVAFAGDHDLTLLAEGIENREELSALQSLGVSRAQGYFFHKPMPMAPLLGLLNEVNQAS